MQENIMNEKFELKIKGMKCEHCCSLIEDELGSMTGVKKVKCSLENKSVCIDINREILVRDQIIDKLDELGYEVIG